MKNKYAMTEQQIEALAADRQGSASVTEAFDGTYLKVLITGTQSKLGAKRGRTPAVDTQLAALEGVAGPFYAAVLRGVITPDIHVDASTEPDEVRRRTREKNRRAVFARSAKSTLVQWVREGGDLRALDVATVSKGELRTSVAAARSERGVTAADRVEKAQETILAVVAHEGPETAKAYLEGVIQALQHALDEMPGVHHESAVIRTRVGVPHFREPIRARA